MINSRNIDDLTPEIASLCRKFIAVCLAEGIDILITSTYRDKESQDALYNQGRLTVGKIVTNAKAGQSFHNYRVAFDFVPLVHGKPVWNDITTFVRCGLLGESLGLEWAGRFKTFKEYAHFQKKGVTLKDVR
jgi:peptidoglycan L-alanyl-D-glutamate endopeptidase CwlK